MAVFPNIQCPIAHALRRLFLSCHYSLNLQPQITSCQGQLLKALHWQSGCMPQVEGRLWTWGLYWSTKAFVVFEAHFRRSFLVNQAAINIAKFSKTTALKRTNFSFNIFSQLQFQNHNWLVKPPGPLEHISHISFFCSQILFTLTREKNMLIATFLETKYKLTSVIL